MPSLTIAFTGANTVKRCVPDGAKHGPLGHVLKNCNHVPESTRVTRLKEKKSSAGGGRKYWSDAAGVMGIFETDHGLRFEAT
jgi:hypothetical protein